MCRQKTLEWHTLRFIRVSSCCQWNWMSAASFSCPFSPSFSPSFSSSFRPWKLWRWDQDEKRRMCDERDEKGIKSDRRCLSLTSSSFNTECICLSWCLCLSFWCCLLFDLDYQNKQNVRHQKNVLRPMRVTIFLVFHQKTRSILTKWWWKTRREGEEHRVKEETEKERETRKSQVKSDLANRVTRVSLAA